MKQTIIIFEGHDKAGKSTIAKALSEKIQVPIFKVKRNKYLWDAVVNLNYLTEGITQFIEQTQSSAILDRWHASDYVYGKLFDRDVSYRKIFELDERFADMDALIVICYKKEASYIPDEEDKEFITMNDYSKMTDLYKEFILETKCRFVFIDTSDENLETQLQTIIHNI